MIFSDIVSLLTSALISHTKTLTEAPRIMSATTQLLFMLAKLNIKLTQEEAPVAG